MERGFTFQWGEVFFRWGALFLSEGGGVPHRGDTGFDGGFRKKIVGWRGCHPFPPPPTTMGNPVPSVLDCLIRSMIKHSST